MLWGIAAGCGPEGNTTVAPLPQASSQPQTGSNGSSCTGEGAHHIRPQWPASVVPPSPNPGCPKAAGARRACGLPGQLQPGSDGERSRGAVAMETRRARSPWQQSCVVPPTPLWGCILRRCTPAGVPCPPATTSDRAPGPAPWVGREVAAPPHPPLGGRALAPSMPPQPPDLMARRKRQGRARLLGFITPHTTCSRTGSWPGSRQESWVQRGPEAWVGSGAPQGCPSAPEGQWGPCGEGQKDAVPLPGWQTSWQRGMLHCHQPPGAPTQFGQWL